MRTTIRSVTLLALVTVAACSAKHSPSQATVSAPPPPLEAIATTRQVMLGITIPTSDVVFQVGAKAPADDMEWEKVEANALALAESGTLLTIGARAIDQQEWLKHCQDLIATAKTAAAAAHEKNVDKVLDAGNAIYEVCDTCHKKYMLARQGEDQQPP
jgi:hypothetical protein